MESQDGSMGNGKEWACIKTEDQPNTWISYGKEIDSEAPNLMQKPLKWPVQ